MTMKEHYPSSSVVYAGRPLAHSKRVLQALPQCHVLECELNSDKVTGLCEALGPTILIVDYDSLKRLEGGQVPATASLPALQLLVLSGVCDAEVYQATLRAGCSGVLPADSPVEMFQRVIKAMTEGEMWYPRSVLSALARGSLLGAQDQPRLTARELEILRLLGAEQKNQAIADQLFISRETVRWHLRALYSKIGVTGRLEARRYALSATIPRHRTN
jgi:DNA-binding NarL/FixJ family response regulator